MGRDSDANHADAFLIALAEGAATLVVYANWFDSHPSGSRPCFQASTFAHLMATASTSANQGDSLNFDTTVCASGGKMTAHLTCSTEIAR